MLIPERLTEFQSATMGEGCHRKFDENASPIEWAAYLAGERHSSTPECVCPIIAAVVQKWNEKLKPEDRTRVLKDYVPQFIGTRSTDAVSIQRGWMVLDWHIHVWLTTWIHASDKYNVSPILRDVPRITDLKTVRHANYTMAEAFEPIRKEWSYEIRSGQNFAAIEKVLHRVTRWSGADISEYLFEEVMLEWPLSVDFGLERMGYAGEWPPPGWWPPLIRITSNFGWFSAQSLVWPSREESPDAKVAAERIFAPYVEEQYAGLQNLIEHMLAA